MKTVTHLAIKHKPPCFKFQYKKPSSTRSYHKSIGIKISDYSEAFNLVAALAEKHPELCHQVPTQTLVDLIDRLSSNRQAESSNSDDNNIFYSPAKNVSQKLTKYEDLNHASEEQLSLAKKEMNVMFEHTLINPGDARYEYDKRIEFEADEESSWD
eukprot:scaffold15753_cov69-Skeletonema_dohrnii-CCMP3373.AAC.2